MTDFRNSAAPRRAPDDAEREARHQVLIDLLGAYADAELPPETASQIDAHLIACERCRREIGVQRALRGRLAAEPPAAASPALRDRIAVAVSAAPAPRPAPEPAPPERGPRRTQWTHRRALLAGGGLVAFVLAVLAAGARWGAPPAGDAGGLDAAPAAVTRLPAPGASVPLLAGILADYRRTVAGDLPGRARDLAAVRAAVPFPVEPIPAPQLRLLAAWTTTVNGEPAAVLAYRWDERLVLQYFVPEQSFFRHSAVRLAVAARRHLAAVDGEQGVVAWAEPAAGSVLVADVAPELLARVWAARRR